MCIAIFIISSNLNLGVTYFIVFYGFILGRTVKKVLTYYQMTSLCHLGTYMPMFFFLMLLAKSRNSRVHWISLGVSMSAESK